jgi:hypothetical protein
MPLDSIAHQWGQFGAEVITASAFQVTSTVFAALARETIARQRHLEAWRASRKGQAIDLEHTLDELIQARQHWTEAIACLAILARDVQSPETSPETMRLLVTEAMEQRLRLSMLLQEIAREQLLAYRSLSPALQRQEVVKR